MYSKVKVEIHSVCITCIVHVTVYHISCFIESGTALYTLLTCIAGESVSELTDLYRVSRSIRVNLYYSIPGKTDICVYLYVKSV